MPATRLRGGGCAPSKPDGPPSLDAINRGLPQKPQEQSMSEAVLGQTIAASAPVAVASIVLETSKDAPAPAPPPSVVVPDDADAPAADANAPAAEKKQRRPSAEGARRVAANDVFGNYNTVPSRRLSRDPSQQVPTQFGLLAREQSLAAEEASPEIVIQKSKAERDAKKSRRPSIDAAGRRLNACDMYGPDNAPSITMNKLAAVQEGGGAPASAPRAPKPRAMDEDATPHGVISLADQSELDDISGNMKRRLSDTAYKELNEELTKLVTAAEKHAAENPLGGSMSGVGEVKGGGAAGNKVHSIHECECE